MIETNPRRRLLITITVMAATTMHALDATIANVALPQMQGSFSATVDQVSWVLTSYIVASAICTPLTAPIAEKFGRRNTFFWAATLFTAASMACGAAATLEQIVLFRVLQGAFGAALIPLSQALLLDTYPPHRHAWAMAIWGVGVMLGPIMGPTLGGWLTDELTWRWVFYVNLPVGIGAALGILFLVREPEHVRKRRFDVQGFAFLALAIGSFQLMLDRGHLLDWFDSTEIVIEAIVAAVALTMFVLHVASTDHPFVSLELFEDRNLALALAFGALAGMILITTAALLPPFLQDLKGYPVFLTGQVLAPRGVGMMVAMLMVSRLSGKVDARLLLAFGLSTVTYSIWLMTDFTLDVSVSAVVWSGVAQGFGLGFVFVPLSTLAFITVAPQHRTEAASLYALLRNLGGSIGIAVLVSMLSAGAQRNKAEIGEAVGTLQPGWSLAPILPGLDPTQRLQVWDNEITRQALSIGYLNDFYALMYVTMAAMPLLLFLRPPTVRR